MDRADLRLQGIIAEYLKKERLEKVNSLQKEIEFSETVYTKYVKRLLDIFLSAVAIIFTIPINLILAFMTYVILGSPIFFIQERVGKDGKVFKLLKFRNMTMETDENGVLLPAKQRLTKFGKFVRRTSLDELLNFWSIFKGDMSIIGPRALPIDYYERYSKRHLARLKVKPGLECPPRKLIDHARSWDEQFEDDCWYVANISFKTDCYLVWRLVVFSLDRKNVKNRAQCEKGSFVGYSFDGKAISSIDVDNSIIERALKMEETNNFSTNSVHSD